MDKAMLDYERIATRFQPPIAAPPFHAWTTPNGTPWAWFYRRGSDYLLRFPKLADFQIRSDGSEVRCWPVPAVSDETIRHLYLNQILPLALSLQRRLVLHGSAVEVEGAAVVFVGRSGAGKSTLAASFGTQGYSVLSDDAVLLDAGAGGYRAYPGNPSIRLWEDSQAAVIGPCARLAPPVQYTAKARILAQETMAFCEQPRPVQRVYLLGDGGVTATALWPATAREALVELIRHSFMLEIEAPDSLARHFDQLSRLVHEPLFYRLDYPRCFKSLASVREAILKHMSNSGLSHEAG